MNQLTSKFSPDAVTNHADKHASASYESPWASLHA